MTYKSKPKMAYHQCWISRAKQCSSQDCALSSRATNRSETIWNDDGAAQKRAHGNQKVLPTILQVL